MYEDLMKDVQEKMQPAIDVAEVNKKALETLFSLQSEYVTDFVDSSVAQLKALSEVKEAKEAVELQVKFFKELEGKMTSVAEKEMAALTEAKEEISGIVEKSLSEISEMPYMSDFNKFLTEAAEAATATATAAVTPAAEVKAAPTKAEPTPGVKVETAPAPAKRAPAKKAPAKRKPAAKKAAPAAE
ncbi:phasin family protein [Neptuniibacter sp.]|uniref:phasin family protein n=1 Tax=Neptuniibacter sp. TaxID=1962643 RepID=UPI00262F39E5|nr:phasin family protein [Neptuniibacter sp.]MCP4597842.1 phasin family protein [Neptuniibacter sp.]